MIVRFIAHAGIYIEEDGVSILIDPWFFESTIENPVIESIAGGFKTIDFQIPRTPEKIENYVPDAVLVSHFHPHHSPARDIRTLLENAIAKAKKPLFLHPKSTTVEEIAIDKKLPKGAQRLSCGAGYETKIGPFTIRALEHTVPEHSAWYVKSNTGSVIHIGDGRLNRDWQKRVVDDVWLRLANLSPTFLFLSSGGHSLRGEKDGRRFISSAGIFSAIEAATIAQIIAPRAVSIIGIYNHSIWKNREEYIQPAAQCEEEFQWALSWLSPRMRNIRLVPGIVLGTGDESIKGTCGVYLP